VLVDRPGPALVVECGGAGRQVGARAEPAAGAGDDNRAHFIVCIGAAERVEQFVLHAPGIGVELVRTVQRDRQDAVCDFVLDVFSSWQSADGMHDLETNGAGTERCLKPPAGVPADRAS
jgi:hypothetical protein